MNFSNKMKSYSQVSNKIYGMKDCMMSSFWICMKKRYSRKREKVYRMIYKFSRGMSGKCRRTYRIYRWVYVIHRTFSQKGEPLNWKYNKKMKKMMSTSLLTYRVSPLSSSLSSWQWNWWNSLICWNLGFYIQKGRIRQWIFLLPCPSSLILERSWISGWRIYI